MRFNPGRSGVAFLQPQFTGRHPEEVNTMKHWGAFAVHVVAAVIGHVLFWTLTLAVPVLAS